MTGTDRLPLDHVVTTTLVAGTEVKRCYRLDRSPSGFWAAADVRFGAAPRRMLFTGDTDTAAVGETLLRDPMPIAGTNRIVLPYDHVRQRGLATLRLLHDVTMVSLRVPAIHACIADPDHLEGVRALIRTRKGYEDTSRFATALLAQARGVEALAWPSQRVDGHTVYCFYEGQVSEGSFEVVDQAPFNTSPGRERLIQAVADAGFVLVSADGRSMPSPEDP